MSRKKKDGELEGVPLDLRVKKTVNPVTKIVEEIQELASIFYLPYQSNVVFPSTVLSVDSFLW